MSSQAEHLRRVKIFIASPGDTANERERVRRAVDRVNKLVAMPNGILFEAIGWEDIPAGKANRTQEVINPYVESADIFVGILNKKFGTPTGFAESGTAEEYNIATKRWNEEDPPPQIGIYFKKLTEEELRKPSEQLQRVLDFKKGISKTDLYHEFESVERLGELVEESLADWAHGSSGPVSVDRESERLQQVDLDVLLHLAKSEKAAEKTAYYPKIRTHCGPPTYYASDILAT